MLAPAPLVGGLGGLGEEDVQGGSTWGGVSRLATSPQYVDDISESVPVGNVVLDLQFLTAGGAARGMDLKLQKVSS